MIDLDCHSQHRNEVQTCNRYHSVNRYKDQRVDHKDCRLLNDKCKLAERCFKMVLLHHNIINIPYLKRISI